MGNMKINKFLLGTTIISIIILCVGATFSYFSFKAMSDADAIAVEAGKIDLSLSISSLYGGYKLYPCNDEDIIKAYNQECIDDFGRGACVAYDLKVSNYNKIQDLIGTIEFEIENIENLSYMVLNEDGSIYLDKNHITGDTYKMSLGDHFILNDGNNVTPTSREFILLIWLTNLNKDQNEIDADGSFTATVLYSSVYGNKLTGSIGENRSFSNVLPQQGGDS